MKLAMPPTLWRSVQHRLHRARERQAREEEISLAQAIQVELPELSWGQAVSEACRLIARRSLSQGEPSC